MINLRYRLHESLLDDEIELVDDDNVEQEIFYKECKEFMPSVQPEYIYSDCKYNNKKIVINRQVYICNHDYYYNKINPKYYFFRGFSVSPNIEYISQIVVSKYPAVSNFKKISEVNEYPMNIKQIDYLYIYSYNILNYCSNIKIKNIGDVTLHYSEYTELNDDFFKFFKCVNNIDLFSIPDWYEKHPIKPGMIKNINAKSMEIEIGAILKNVKMYKDINKYREEFENFIDMLYKYNNIGELYIFTTNSRKSTYKYNTYRVEKSKSKNSKYILKRYNDE